MSSDFRHIASAAEHERADRLFRASVSAFCSLSRPGKREINQLDDLTTPLLALVSTASKRFVSAALSECRHVPPLLVHLLAEEPVEISAPLLVRSAALSDVDLIALIGRHGLAHARAIARRDGLNPTILSLIRAVEAQEGASHAPAAPAREPGRNAETIRGKLRAIMEYHSVRQSAHDGEEQQSSPHERLRAAALSGVPDLFIGALSEETGIPGARLAPLVTGASRRELAAVLRALELDSDQAYLIVSALHPARFGHAEAIRMFLDAYDAIDDDMAAAVVAALAPANRSEAPRRSA